MNEMNLRWNDLKMNSMKESENNDLLHCFIDVNTPTFLFDRNSDSSYISLRYESTLVFKFQKLWRNMNK